jgi:hypothetical protein
MAQTTASEMISLLIAVLPDFSAPFRVEKAATACPYARFMVSLSLIWGELPRQFRRSRKMPKSPKY